MKYILGLLDFISAASLAGFVLSATRRGPKTAVEEILLGLEPRHIDIISAVIIISAIYLAGRLTYSLVEVKANKGIGFYLQLAALIIVVFGFFVVGGHGVAYNIETKIIPSSTPTKNIDETSIPPTPSDTPTPSKTPTITPTPTIEEDIKSVARQFVAFFNTDETDKAIDLLGSPELREYFDAAGNMDRETFYEIWQYRDDIIIIDWHDSYVYQEPYKIRADVSMTWTRPNREPDSESKEFRFVFVFSNEQNKYLIEAFDFVNIDQESQE